MFLTRRALKEKALRLECRIADLEERLCPYNQHDMIIIGHDYEFDIGGGSVSISTYKCKRCGKIVKKNDWED